MRKRMRYFWTFCFAALLCAGVMMGNPAVVHAEEDVYDFSTHEQAGMYIYMDNTHGYECDIELFVLTQNDLNYTSYKIPYHFTCYSPLPEEYSDYQYGVPFGFTTYTPNGDEIAVVGNDTVYSYNWTMKAGDYAFSYPESNGNLSVLTSTFEAPFIDPEYGGFYTVDDFTNGTYDVVTIENGDYVRIYALCGEFQWAKEASAAFIEWAKEYDQNFNVDDGSGDDPLAQNNHDDKEKEEVSTEPVLSFGSETSEEEEEPVIMEQPVEQLPPELEEEKTMPGFLAPVVFVLCAALFLFILFKKRKRR